MPLDDTAPYETMGATLLAQQPATQVDPPTPGKNWERIFQHVESRLQGLKIWRYSWWTYWASLAQYLLPRRYVWLAVANRVWRGGPINNSIIDSTATLAMQICASGLWTGLTSPSRPWFKLGIALPWIELDADGKAWLEDTEQRVLTVLGQSNFYTTMAQAFQDVSTFGTAPVIIYEDAEDVIRLYLPCAGEYYLGTGSRFSVEVFYREFVLNVSQLVEMFKLENVPEEVAKAWKSGGGQLQSEYVVCHAIEPNTPISADTLEDKEIRVVPAFFTFREVYWIKGQKNARELSRRGFHELPFMTARWSVVQNDAYGRSPGMDALGDTKQLQLMTLRAAEFVEKLVRPPMVGDVSMKNEPSSIRPGDITYGNIADGKRAFMPAFEVAAPALGPLTESIKTVQQRIERCFYVPIFMAITQMEGVQPRNELELTKRDIERLQVLGPFITLFETEFAGPAIQRVMAILQRRRMLKPMPPSLQKVPLKIDYVSIMKLAQRASELIALKEVLTTAGAMSEAALAAGQPNPIRVLDLDAALRDVVSMANANPNIVKTDERVCEEDEQRAQHQQQQQALQATLPAVGAAKALGETSLSPENALGALIGRTGGAGGAA